MTIIKIDSHKFLCWSRSSGLGNLFALLVWLIIKARVKEQYGALQPPQTFKRVMSRAGTRKENIPAVLSLDAYFKVKDKSLRGSAPFPRWGSAPDPVEPPILSLRAPLFSLFSSSLLLSLWSKTSL